MTLTEKRRKTLINIAYFAFFLVLYYVFIKYAFGIVAPFVIAFVVAMVLQKPINYLDKKTFVNKKFASVILVLLVMAAIAGIFTLIGYKVWNELSNFITYLTNKFGNYNQTIEMIKNWINSTLSHLPHSISEKAKEYIDEVTASVLNLAEKQESAHNVANIQSANKIDFSMLSGPLSGILATAKQVPSILTAVLISIISCFFLTSDYQSFTRVIKNAVSEEKEEKLVRAKYIIINVLGRWIRSYALILFITFCEMALGLSILKLFGVYKNGYIFAIAILTALLDILPVFGTGTVLVPWAIYNFLTHNIAMGIGLIVIYALIFIIRQVIEPKIVSANVDIHPVITIMAMYIGAQLFGVLGIFILPITIVVINTLNEEGLIHIYGRNKGDSNANSIINEIPKPQKSKRKKGKSKPQENSKNTEEIAPETDKK